MAESKISPAELLSGFKTVERPDLKRKPTDVFYEFIVADYVKSINVGIKKASIHKGYRDYLLKLVEYTATANSGVKSKIALEIATLYTAYKTEIDTAEVVKYFGEVIGPLHIANLTDAKGKATHIIFPQRSNYELFDYFVVRNKEVFGYSAKAAGGSSNTLAPKLITERLNHQPKLKQTLGAQILVSLANDPTFEGTVKSVGLLAKNDIFPRTMQSDAALKTAFKKIRWETDASTIERNKSKKLIDKSMPLSGRDAYVKFVHEHVVPRMIKKPAKGYAYDVTNLIYGFIAMYLADCSKEGRFNITPIIKQLFTDLNILKMGIDTKTGLPNFHLIARGQVEGGTLRSKARWDVIKDKLGVQL